MQFITQNLSKNSLFSKLIPKLQSSTNNKMRNTVAPVIIKISVKLQFVSSKAQFYKGNLHRDSEQTAMFFLPIYLSNGKKKEDKKKG